MFKYKLEGNTFQVTEMDESLRDKGSLFIASNGWEIISCRHTEISVKPRKIFIRGTETSKDLVIALYDPLHHLDISRALMEFSDSLINSEGEKMKDKIKAKVKEVSTILDPYKKYLVIAAVLLALDHFVLKGALRTRIQELATSLSNKLVGMLDTAIAKIGGSDDK